MKHNQPLVWVIECRENDLTGWVPCVPIEAYNLPQEAVRKAERWRGQDPAHEYRATIYRRVVMK